MKPIFTGIVMILAAATCLAQEGTQLTVDGMIRNYRIQSSERTVIQPGVSVSMGMHQLRIAPILQNYTSEARKDPRNLKFTGFSGSYALHINTRASFLKQRFFYEMTWQAFNNSWEAIFFNDQTQTYEPVEYESRELFTSHMVGYGFVVYPFKGLFIKTSVGSGIYVSNISGGPVRGSNNVNERIDFRGYDDFGLGFQLNAGLGYTF